MRWLILNPSMASYDQLPLLTTPLKVKRLYRETLETQQSDYKTKSAEVERELRVELHGAVFVNTPRFFDKFFDVPPSVVDHISTEIHTQGYHDGSRWAAFPNKKDFFEKDLYVTFRRCCQLYHKSMFKQMQRMFVGLLTLTALPYPMIRKRQMWSLIWDEADKIAMDSNYMAIDIVIGPPTVSSSVLCMP
jgi:hypothetical protein